MAETGKRTTARDLACTHFATLREDARLVDALDAFVGDGGGLETGCTLLVLDDDGRVQGLLPSRRLLHALVSRNTPDEKAADGADPEAGPVGRAAARLDVPVADVMHRDVPTVGPDETLARLIELTAGSDRECVPLVEEGRVTAVVRLSDVFLAAAGLALAPRDPSVADAD